MRICHMADTHLGFRAFARCGHGGLNQREIDVMVSFKRVLTAMLGQDPEIVVHSGDLFHLVKPSNHTITESYRAIEAFQKARGYRPFILTGGNHDTPKTSDVGNIQSHIADIDGVFFAGQMAERFDLPDLDTEVLCVPSNSLQAREEVALRPMLGRRYSILSVHGMARQALPRAVEGAKADFDVDELHPDMFTYTALGDFHCFTRYAHNCCFSGSTDFTSSNIWEEVPRVLPGWEDVPPKGWVLYDTDSEKMTFHPVATREVLDLDPLDASELSVEDIHAAMIARADCFEGDPIVRQRVVNLHPGDRAKLFRSSVIREIGAKCLAFKVVTSPPLVDRGTGERRETGSGRSLETAWSDHVAGLKPPQGITVGALESAGLELLREVAQSAG